MEHTRHRPRAIADIVAPRSVLVVGASASRGSATGNQVIRTLRAAGFAGSISVLNPAGGMIEGAPAFATAAEAPRAELAVIAVAPARVLGAVQEVSAAGVRAALVMSVGMTGAERRALASFADDAGIVVHGPNCMGVINVRGGVMLWANEGILTDLPAGSVALISQSGSGAIFVARSMTGVGFSHVVSTGNETCLTTADYIEFLVDDPDTTVIGIIVESIPDPDRFREAVARARAAGKPVVALKVGRSSAGSRATVAHTGAMAAEDSVVSALFDRIGVPLVADYDELAAALEVLANLGPARLGAGRIAVITISGGQAALAADLADRAGATLATLEGDTVRGLAEILPGASVDNPLDAGGSEDVSDDWYARCLDLLAGDPNVDVILPIVDAQASLNTTEIDFEGEIVADIRAASRRHPKPIVMASSSALSIHPARVGVLEGGTPTIRGIGNALTAIVAAQRALGVLPESPTRPEDLPSADDVAELRRRVAAAGHDIDNELGGELLAAYGIATPPGIRARTRDEAVEWARSAVFPLVLKIDSPDIPHRTEVQGVVLGIADIDELERSWSELFDRVRAARPDARLEGAELQSQLSGAIEAIVGAVRDPGVGATIGVGLGGIMVELIADTQSVLVPVSEGDARAALGRTRLRRLLDGYRNITPRVDDAALVDAIVRVSWLMTDLDGLIAEFEANPVLIDPRTGAVFAADVLLVPAR